ncbi:YrhB domain-containing protein [Streptomyces sp. NPDC051704]|uniref:YrhB domain-containing protein n=1 Tax=Streptomyces sp. NPDC051704 TaxID=3365671 RepID=UPI0037AD1B28
MFPALEHALVLTSAGPLALLDSHQTPAAIRRMGTTQLTRWLRARGICTPEERAVTAVGAAERKRRTQAVIALARRRVNVLRALIRDRRFYDVVAQEPTSQPLSRRWSCDCGPRILLVSIGSMVDAARVIERETAVRIVEEELDREDQKWAARGVAPVPKTVLHVEEHELVWKVYWQSEEYARTRNPAAMLVGHGPYLVDRLDGGLHEIGAVSEIEGAWEADYRVRIRGMAVRTPVDDLHDEIREAAAVRGRMQAVRILRRRLPMLSPSQALEYVSALLQADAPAHLVTLAVEQLIEPMNPVLAVQTIRQGKPGQRI